MGRASSIGKMAQLTKAAMWMTRKKGTEFLFGLRAVNMKGTGSLENSMATGRSLIQTGRLNLVIGILELFSLGNQILTRLRNFN
jgi:hypothetical protein